MANLLMGRYMGDTDITDMALQFNIFFRNPLFRIIVIQMYSFINSGLKLSGKDNERIYEIIGQLFHRCGQYTLGVEPGWTVVILNYTEEDLPGEALICAANQMLNALNKEFPGHKTIGISGEEAKLSELSKAYSQAVSACEYRLIRGYGVVIFASEVEGLINDISLQYMQTFKNQSELEKHLESGDYETIEHNINQLFIDIRKNNLSISLARCIYYEIINMVMRTLPYGFVKKINFHKLIQAGTMDQLHCYILKIYHQACCEIKNRSGKPDPAEIAVKYIQEHYSRPELSLEMAARDLGYSRTHLSRVFSRQMHHSFNEYLNWVRIDNACLMLANRELSVTQVGQRVGYWDLHTFLRNFKKVIGMTPSHYRDLSTDAVSDKSDHFEIG
jgi:YesN/AraC family two-component response regulator